ncbi:MAG: PaaI family thioesterase [Deltaproteobacteria bacterium]|nr:PaaI family thioesterase [Deltaproteobacteria bacterium]
MDNLLQLGKQVLASQPFSKLVGAELTSFSQGRAELTVPVTQKLQQQNGLVHGGVISYAVDNALTFAGGSVLGPEVVTSGYTINYLRPAMGTAIIARAAVIYSSKSRAVCRCEVFSAVDGKENLCAASQGTIAMIGRSSANKA